MPYLFISYNRIISWLYTVNGFRIIFLLRDSATQEFILTWEWRYVNVETKSFLTCFWIKIFYR